VQARNDKNSFKVQKLDFYRIIYLIDWADNWEKDTATLLLPAIYPPVVYLK
jgi:hypothetical protein